jgi:hypothetical protein
MHIEEKQKTVFRAIQNTSVIIGLIVGFLIYMQYSAEKLSKDGAYFSLCVLGLVLFCAELIISLITKESVIQAGTVSKRELPNHYKVAVAMKVIFCIIFLLGVIYYYPS